MPRGTPQRPGKSRGIDGGLWKTRGRKPAGDMSNQNSAVSETESECDFYSVCWDEIALPISQDLVNSDSESNHCLPVKSPCGLFEKQKQKSKTSKPVEISGNDQASFKNRCKDYPLLQVQKLDNTGEFHVKLLPETILQLNVKDYHSSDHPSKTYSSKQNSLRYLNRKIPHITDKLVKEQTLKETCRFHKLDQKLSTADYTSTSKHNKAVQVFFPCRETETGKNIVCECFKQSAIPAEVNKTPINFKTFYGNESQLVNDNVDCASELSYKIDNPQTAEQNYLNTSSGKVVISLAIEATYVDPVGTLPGNISSSKGRQGKEDSQKNSLAFQVKNPDHNQLSKELLISVVPRSVHLDSEKQKQTTSLTNKVGFAQSLLGERSQILGTNTETSESSYPLTTHTESSASSSLDFHSEQVFSALKPLSLSQLFPSSKSTYANHSPHFFVRSLPHYKVASALRTSKVQKGQPKASRTVNSVVFTPPKVQKNKRHKGSIFSKFHWPKALEVEPINENISRRGEINDLCHLPLIQTTKCCCSPLLDLIVDLYSAEKNSENLYSVHRKPPKRTGCGKITHRFSSHYLLNPKSNFERSEYISQVRKTNNLKMQNILNYCLGWAGRQNTHNNCNGEICSTPNSSNTQDNVILTSYSPADGKHSTVPSSKHSPVRGPAPCLQLERGSPAALYLLANEKRHACVPYMQNERGTWNPAASYSDCRCSISHSPCTNFAKVEKLPKEQNTVNNICMEKLDYGTDQVACGGLVLKELSVCPCGNKPQCDLFPSGDISESVRKKTRASPDSNCRAAMTESNWLNSPTGTLNTEKAFCASCHHGFPSCSLSNTDRQVSRNQFIKLASYFDNGFSAKNLKEDVAERSKARKTDERKNFRFHVGSGTRNLEESGTSGAPIASPNDGHQTPTCFVSQPLCLCCRTAVKKYLGTSHDCFASECKLPKNCLNRESVFLVDSWQGTKSQCKCSQEILPFNINPTNTCKENRPAISKRRECDLIQDSSQINRGWKILDGNHKCC